MHKSFRQRYQSVLVLSLITLTVCAAGYFAIRKVERTANENVKSHLELILDGTTMMIAYGFDSVLHEVEIVKTSDNVQTAVETISGGTATEQAKNRLKERIRLASSHRHLLGFIVTSNNGNPLIASDSALVNLSTSFVFHVPKNHDTLQDQNDIQISLPRLMPELAQTKSSDRDAPLAIALRTRLKDSAGKDLLTLWMIYDARALFAAVLQPGRTGSTGEIYAFDVEGRMISDSRFNQHLYDIGLLQAGTEAALRLQLRDPLVNLRDHEKPVTGVELPLTRMAASATLGHDDVDISGYRDYRGVPVVGAWKWFDRYGFGVTHEIDYAEAFYNVRILLAVVIGLVVLLLLATGASALASVRAWEAEEKRHESENRLKGLQDEIAHVNRLATMGEMATGLAHEISQPLAAATNYARAALNMLKSVQNQSQNLDQVKLQDHLTHIENNTLRSGEIIKRLRKFVSHHEVETKPIPIANIIRDPLKLLSAEISRLKITPAVDISTNLPDILGDEVQLQQVILNLVRNSIDAMSKQSNRDHNLSIEARMSSDNRHVILDITDTGGGIDPKVHSRLFEQFNSSNPEGMGLGLAISRTIIEAHGGTIMVAAESSKGTTFRVKLPFVE